MRSAPSRRLSMPHRQRGFTFIELIGVLVLFGVLIYIAAKVIGMRRRVITGIFTTSPPTVSSSGTGTFVWTMTQTVGGAPAAPIVNRPTSFVIAPAAHARIVSITDSLGAPQAVDATTGTGGTDAQGNVTVIVKIDYIGSATLTATDTTSGNTEIAKFAGVP